MPQDLVDRLDRELKDAMRAREAERVACIRQVKAKLTEARDRDLPGAAEAAAGGADALLAQVVASYTKQLKAAIGQLAPAGARSEPLRARYAAEIAYLQAYLPSRLDADATARLVDEAISHARESGGRLVAGPLIGALLRAHPDALDTTLLRSLVEQALAADRP